MGEEIMTKIQWTNETWNPIIGCDKISEGCKNCYAEKMAKRLASINSTSYYLYVVKGEYYGTNQAVIHPKWNGNTHFVQSALEKPFKWKKPRMIFVCSMGDLFHDSVKSEDLDKVIKVIIDNPQHTFQVLTKRPENMQRYFKYLYSKFSEYTDTTPIPNLWLGVTAENQKRANERIPVLLQIPAAKRFVSCEPLLRGINLRCIKFTGRLPGSDEPYAYNINALNKLDWVIVGPETGPRARPMQKEWIENIYNQCKVANVSFFDKKDTLGLNLKQFPND
jgi:protein gp37